MDRNDGILDLSKINKLIVGNFLELHKYIPEKSIDLVVTDPPFYIMNKKNIKFKHRADIIQSAEFDGFESFDDFIEFTQSWVKITQSKLKPNGSMYIFFGAQFISDLYRICLNLGFKYKGIIVWHKTNPAPKIRKNGFLSSTELILFVQQGNPTFNFLGQNLMHNMIETPICMQPERLKDQSILNSRGKHPTLHPTQKPEKVIKKLIEISSNPGDLVLDPFTGTGTTNVVCKKLSRRCIGFEINEKYISAARNRLKQK